MIRRKYLTHDQISKLVRVGLAVASFVIYVFVTIVLREHHYSEFHPERYSLAAAISHVVYGAPTGTIYKDVLGPLLDLSRPIQQTFEEAARVEVDTISLLRANPDGNGIGFPAIATIAMYLFGVHLRSLTLLLIALMGISTLLFVLRYRDDRLFFIPLYFFSLTLICFTPFTTDQGILNEAPVGGIRYFTLLAIIPAMHLLLEIADPSRGDVKAASGNVVLLGLQSLILVATIIARGNAGYLFGSLVVVVFFFAWAQRKSPERLLVILSKGAVIAVVSAVFICLFYLWVPKDYKDTGRTNGIVWHRVLISLGANPAWPFGNLWETYSECKRYIPEILIPGIVDRNGQCIWGVHTAHLGLADREFIDGIYSGQYEKVMKKAFFMIVRAYPREVLKTFVIYKPAMIVSSMRFLLKPSLPGKTVGIKLFLITLLIAQIATFLAFVIFGVSGALKQQPKLLCGALLLFWTLGLMPYFVAWSVGHTSAELLFYVLSGLGLLLASLV